MSLTGSFGLGPQLTAMRYARKWIEEIPLGDSICLRCESTVPDKQFRIWKKWFQTREDPNWEISEEHKSFFFYKKRW